MKSAKWIKHTTFSSSYSDVLVLKKTSISETKEKNLEKLAVLLLKRHLFVTGDVFAFKNIPEPKEDNSST